MWGARAGGWGGRRGLFSKLDALLRAELTAQQGVVERVVWEVVPNTAEALIREEIARILREKTS